MVIKKEFFHGRAKQAGPRARSSRARSASRSGSPASSAASSTLRFVAAMSGRRVAWPCALTARIEAVRCRADGVLSAGMAASCHNRRRWTRRVACGKPFSRVTVPTGRCARHIGGMHGSETPGRRRTPPKRSMGRPDRRHVAGGFPP